ncbi:hypothetical protein Droror1_Dr00027504 [Drosera rotundifolia]
MKSEAEIAKGLVVSPLVMHHFRSKKTKAHSHAATIFHHDPERFEVKTDRLWTKPITKDPIPYVDDCYRMTTHLSTWAPQFRVVRDPSAWSPYEGPIIMPWPETKRNRDRPRTHCIHNEMDIRRAQGNIRCRQCAETTGNFVIINHQNYPNEAPVQPPTIAPPVEGMPSPFRIRQSNNSGDGTSRSSNAPFGPMGRLFHRLF